MMEQYIIFHSEDHCTYIKIHPENNSFITIINVDRDQRTSIKTKIHPKTHVLLRLNSLDLVQK